MALLRSGTIGDVSGRLGGVEIAQVGGRSIIKHAKLRQSSGSEARTRAQNVQAAAIAHWRGLTDAQRLAWEVVAQGRTIPDRFGVPRLRNGFQLFMTIPHDFRYGITQTWFDIPPTRSLTYAGTPVPTLNAGYDFTVLFPSINEHLQYNETFICAAYISRFRPENSTRKAYQWIKAGMDQDPTDHIFDFATSMEGQNISLIEGERVSVKLKLWGYYVEGESGTCWPTDYDCGVVTVGA
jgi:hypothetical protein